MRSSYHKSLVTMFTREYQHLPEIRLLSSNLEERNRCKLEKINAIFLYFIAILLCCKYIYLSKCGDRFFRGETVFYSRLFFLLDNALLNAHFTK